VDDLGLSFESTNRTRQALRKFVDQQMQPDDLVAIVRTSAGAGALQQFTSDRRQLHAAIDRVRWYATGRGGISAFAPIQRDPATLTAGGSGAAGGGDDGSGSGPESPDSETELNDFREEIFAVGTLGAINYVVRGMRELPGRKSVVLLSEGFSLFTPDRGRGRSDRVLEALRRLTDLANRASVVIYAMDVRGLVYTGPTAADDLGGMTPEQISAVGSSRNQQIFDTQSGLNYLARQTGGLFVRNSNDLTGGVEKILADQPGYYLIGYRPERETFDRRFHTLSAKVRGRSDLTVRTRTGFYGVSDEEARPAGRTGDQQLVAALMSPFSSGDVRLRLTAFFTAGERLEPYVSSQLHLDARDLKFERGADGWHAAKIDVLAVAFGDNGRVVDQHSVSQTLRLRQDVFDRAARAGIVYTINVPVKKAGAYQLRTAVRDVATGRVGSASQFVEVVDLKKSRLSLSGLVISGSPPQAKNSATAAAARGAAATPAGGAQTAAAAAAAPQQGSSDAAQDDPEATNAVRRFRQKMQLDFAYLIFNARADRATGRPQLAAQTRLFRDGRPVYSGAERPVTISTQPDPKRVVVGGSLLLGTDVAPGEYVLQIVVTDTLRRDKHRTATQWIDFEIVR